MSRYRGPNRPTQVTKRIMDRTQIKYFDARAAQKIVLEALVSLLEEGERVVIPELGVFYVWRGELSVPINPRWPGHRENRTISYLRFRPSDKLKAKLNNVIPKHDESDDGQEELPFDNDPATPSPAQSPAGAAWPSNQAAEAAAGQTTSAAEQSSDIQAANQSAGNTCETGG